MEEIHGNYIIRPVQGIGGGGFGCVEHVEVFNYAGHKCGDYARKIFSLDDPDEIIEFRRRFVREVEYQAACTHTNIAQIYLCNLRTDKPWFVMNLAKNDLNNDIKHNRLSLDEKVRVLEMVLSGISYMHARDYLHRDIKPSNVLKFDDGTYKVSDFGLVMNLDRSAESERITKVAAAMGTKGYMAPEIEAAGIYTRQTDIFALGVLMEALRMDEEDQNFQDVIRKSTARRPAERYLSVDDMLEDIMQAARRAIA